MTFKGVSSFFQNKSNILRLVTFDGNDLTR